MQAKIKSLVTNTNICLNRIFLSFDFLNSEISPGFILTNIFSSYFSFYKADCHNKKSKAVYLHKLDDLVLNVLSDLHTVIVIPNASIRNNITMSIAYIYSFFSSTKKTLHHTIDIIITEAELFAIRCGINQAVWIPNSSHIVVITNTLYMVQNFLILSFIPINSNWLLSQKISDHFLKNICLIPLNFGIVLVIKNGLFMHL